MGLANGIPDLQMPSSSKKNTVAATPAPAISGRTAKEAYAEMPTELVDYIKSLPEYDDEIFRKITGADDDE